MSAVMTERTKVRMLNTVNGLAMPVYGIDREFAYNMGETAELHPKLAEAWFACGHAEPIREEKKAK
jgi:hypothetical protein